MNPEDFNTSFIVLTAEQQIYCLEFLAIHVGYSPADWYGGWIVAAVEALMRANNSQRLAAYNSAIA